MKRILVFCFFPAFVPPSNGGQSRLFHFYRVLSRWYRITLLTSTHIGGEEEVINHGLNFIERRIPKDDHFVRQYARLEQYSGGGDLSGPAIAACGSLPTRLHQAYLMEYEKADAVIFDDPFTAQCDLFAGTDDKPRIYNSYNCESLLYKQLHPGEKSRPIHELVRTAEQRMLENADLVLYCNDDDLTAFREMAPDAEFDALYAPNGMTPTTAAEHTSAAEDKGFRAVFMGSGHPPNMQAAEFIARKLAPALPGIMFDVIGSCLPEGRYPTNVKRYGVVDDAAKTNILCRADMALNPMDAGSGSNVKVLEYFAYGLPVLSTSFGMRGIQAEAGREYLEAPLEQFAQELRQSVADPGSLTAIAVAGQSLAMDSYTWEAIARPVAERVEALVSSRGRDNERRFVLALNDYDSFTGIGGGGTRTRGLYEAVRAWSPVVFVSFSIDGALGARRHGDDITVINVPKTSEHIADLARANAHFHVAVDDILASRHCAANSWLWAIYRVLRQSARCIVVEHCYLAELPLAWGDRFVYSSQNNETELKKRLLEWHPLKAELLPEVALIEQLAVERSAAIIAVSQEDATSLVKGKRTAGPVIVVRNGTAMPAAGEEVERAKQELRDRIGDRPVLFLGSAHPPNVEAAQFIVDRLAPRCPDVRFHLLGSVCGAILQVPNNVHLWGVVDEVTKSAVMQSCALALNPVNLGSGSNVKLADYLINGLFVITTEFGQRGYPLTIQEHVAVVPMDAFAEAIRMALDKPVHFSGEARARRRALFGRELEMRAIAQRFVETLQGLEKQKKRVLYVAYRYAAPALGGAEANIEKFVSALGNSEKFDVDVVAPEISGIHNHLRFSETYSFDPELGVPVDIPNVRFARFPVEIPDPKVIDIQLRKAWSAQPLFERAVDHSLREHYEETGLTWGWGYPEGEGTSAARWAFAECGIFLHKATRIDLEGYAAHAVVVTAYSGDHLIAGPWSMEGKFSLSFSSKAGEVRLATSVPLQSTEPRPLSIRVSRLVVDGTVLDLSAPTLLQQHLPLLPAERSFRLLDQAAQESRTAHGVRLTDGRGPWSGSLERFIADHVADYDLVVTHNNVFRPAVIAIEEAKKHGVPSILIPHAHLDDDFYHFPDWLESARNAGLVLAVPKAACDFLAEKGCNVRYLSAGCDATEQFTLQDQEAFRQVHTSTRPFVLVLGRKAGAKGYRQIIDAVEQLNGEGVSLQAVLIGPDDDGIPVESPNAVYLGRQPRNVVRGALLSCLALCNMSSSESFGIVLLEAWLAGKSVIANKNCAAFHDMAVDGENSLLVRQDGIAEAICRLLDEAELGQRLAENGKRLVARFDWESVAENFVAMCSDLTQYGTKHDVNQVLSDMKNLVQGGVPHEDDFLFFKKLNRSDRPIVFVDVGANAGQSAISFLMNCPSGRVISFEPNLLYQPVLVGVQELLGESRFEFHMCGLSDAESDLDLYIPHVDGVPYMQEASLTLAQFGKPWVHDRLKSYGTKIEIIPVRASFKISDNLIEQADVVKIDAEGAEMSVLRGMRKLIENSPPIFLIENNDWSAVTKYLKAFGYGVYQYDKNVEALLPMSGATTNCFYLRTEHFARHSIPSIH
ncbi:MAG: FkbM family methyltransferase [Candidatus Competibacter sp.]